MNDMSVKTCACMHVRLCPSYLLSYHPVSCPGLLHGQCPAGQGGSGRGRDPAAILPLGVLHSGDVVASRLQANLAKDKEAKWPSIWRGKKSLNPVPAGAAWPASTLARCGRRGRERRSGCLRDAIKVAMNSDEINKIDQIDRARSNVSFRHQARADFVPTSKLPDEFCDQAE